MYPNVNWRDVILKDITWNNQHYLSVAGGGATARYFISAGVQNKSAVFKQDNSVKNYDSNVGWHKYTFRANVNTNLTKTTELGLALDGTIIKQNAPGYGDNNNDLWTAQATLTPLTVPLRYSDGKLPAYGANGNQISPYVLLNHTGFKRSQRSTTKITFSFKQDLSMLTQGLDVRALFSYNNNASFTTIRSLMPNLYKASGRYNDGTLILERTVAEKTSDKYVRRNSVDRQYYFESQVVYNRAFGEHRVGAMIHYYMQDYQSSKAETAIAAIPQRYQALSSRLTYSFGDTYFIEGNLGYTGSENFKPGEQFGFFPSLAIGWVPTQYEWLQKNVPILNYLKFRASYGELGNDRIGGRRFPYITYTNFEGGNRWGAGSASEGQMGADNLKWEIAKKYNFGLDLKILNEKIEFTMDFFKDIRDGIFQERQLMPEEVGVLNKPYSNIGKMRSSGLDGNITYHQKLSQHANLTLRANMTYSQNEVVHWDQAVQRFPYQSWSGVPLSVNRGLIAQGLFRDSLDILSSPKQTFGEVRPGDIKYKDVNGDGKITEDDIVPLSYSSTPQIQYGFAAELTVKNWTFSALFEGIGKVNYFYSGNGFYPYANGEAGNILSIVNNRHNRWTPAWYSGDPSTENPNARFPRLTYGNSANNNRNSTFWLANGRYLRLKNVEISYRLKHDVLRRIGISDVVIQAVGNNLACWDKVKLWDPGQASSNGSVYPLQRTFTLQLSITL